MSRPSVILRLVVSGKNRANDVAAFVRDKHDPARVLQGFPLFVKSGNDICWYSGDPEMLDRFGLSGCLTTCFLAQNECHCRILPGGISFSQLRFRR